MKIVKQILVIVCIIMLIIILISCKEKKLDKLNYPDAIINRVLDTNIALNIINNEIFYSDYLQLINYKNYNEKNLELYTLVLNRVFIVSELDYIVDGINIFALSNKDSDVLLKKDTYSFIEGLIVMKKSKFFKGKNLNLYIDLFQDIYTYDDLDIMMVGANEYLNKNNSYNELLKESKEEIHRIFNDLLMPKLELITDIFNYKKIDNINKYIKEYIIAESYFDNDIIDSIKFIDKFDSNTIGKQVLNIEIVDSKGYKNSLKKEIEIVDKVPPVISLNHEVDFLQGTEIDLLSGVQVHDNYDGDITNKIVLDDGGFDSNISKEYIIKYTVKDSFGNISTKDRTINVIKVYSKNDDFELNMYTLKVTANWYNRTDSEAKDYFYSYYTAENDNTFLIINLKIKNLDDIIRTPFDTFGKDSDMIKAKIIVDDKYEYENAYHGLDNNWYALSGSSISPLSYKVKRLSFEIPKYVESEAKSIIIKFYKHTNDEDYKIVKIR
jgi:hypothetical protein